MSGSPLDGRVPYTFPISTSAGSTERYRQELPEDGRIERLEVFFPKNSKTNLQLTLVLEGDPINEAEATDSSPSIPDYLVGSGTKFNWDVSLPVREGDEIGVDSQNVHGSSDLDGFVAMVVDYRPEPEGGS